MNTWLVVVAYDVVEDRSRQRLRKLLRQFGLPLQKSVFEARLSAKERQRLVERATEIIDPETDQLVVYTIASRQEGSIVVVGLPREEPVQERWFVV